MKFATILKYHESYLRQISLTNHAEISHVVSDNPEKYCWWFWFDCCSNKFERMAREAMDDYGRMFASAKGKKQK